MIVVPHAIRIITILDLADVPFDTRRLDGQPSVYQRKVPELTISIMLAKHNAHIRSHSFPHIGFDLLLLVPAGEAR